MSSGLNSTAARAITLPPAPKRHGTAHRPPRPDCSVPGQTVETKAAGQPCWYVGSAPKPQRPPTATDAEAGIGVNTLLRLETGLGLETGAAQPGLAEVRRLFLASGKELWLRLEIYDPHDDVLHQQAAADADRFDQTLRRTRETAATAVAVDPT